MLKFISNNTFQIFSEIAYISTIFATASFTTMLQGQNAPEKPPNKYNKYVAFQNASTLIESTRCTHCLIMLRVISIGQTFVTQFGKNFCEKHYGWCKC